MLNKIFDGPIPSKGICRKYSWWFEDKDFDVRNEELERPPKKLEDI